MALVAIPTVFISLRIYKFFVPNPPANTYNPETGIGRGAPGFQTGSRRVALPSHIAMRIKLGDEVSADEITEALEQERLRLEKIERDEAEAEELARQGIKTLKVPDSVDTDWLPAGATIKPGQARRRKK